MTNTTASIEQWGMALRAMVADMLDCSVRDANDIIEAAPYYIDRLYAAGESVAQVANRVVDAS